MGLQVNFAGRITIKIRVVTIKLTTMDGCVREDKKLSGIGQLPRFTHIYGEEEGTHKGSPECNMNGK